MQTALLAAAPVDLPVWAEGPASFLTVFFLVYLVARFIVQPLVHRAGKQRSKHIAGPLARTAYYLAVLIGIMAGLAAGGYGSSLAVLGTIAAAGTFAIGFAMKDTLGAFVAGIFIFIDKPFTIGDWVEFDGFEGTVEDITLRTTKIETFNNELLTVPNDKIANTVVKNPVANDRLRVAVTFGIGYDDDIEHAKECILDELDQIEGVAKSPEPKIRTTALSDSTVDLKLLYWINDPRRAKFADIKEELLHRVKMRFEDEGIDMPYPTQTIAGDSITVTEE